MKVDDVPPSIAFWAAMLYDTKNGFFIRFLNHFDILIHWFSGRICEWWQSGEADPVENEPVVSDIPTLIFAGYYDPVTSPEWGQRAAKTLNNSYYYEFPNMGHGVMRSDECAKRIGIEFLDDPWTEPDASCIEVLTHPNFR